METKFGWSYYWKKTPVWARRLGDSLLATSGMAMTYALINEDKQFALWTMIGGLVGKFLTNFFGVPDEKS